MHLDTHRRHRLWRGVIACGSRLRQIRIATPVLVALLTEIAATAAAQTSDPPVVRALHYEIAESQTGRILNTVWGWTEPVALDPQRVMTVSRTAFARGGEWSHRVIFTRESPPRCLSWEGTFTDQTGAVLITTHTQWVAAAFPLLDRPFPPGTYPMEGMGYALTRQGLGAQQKASVYAVLGGTLVQVDLWIDGRETVQVPAGDFECYKVHMRANPQTLFPKLPAFLRPVLSFFIPTYTLWLTVDEPQTLVKFVGQMGPPGSPELLMRLLTISETHP